MSNQNRIWNIFSWNIRGINSRDKWDHIRAKILESGAAIVCLQETKREDFDASYITKFCPKQLNKFAFLPSLGASWGLIVIWKGVFSLGTFMTLAVMP